MTDRKIETPPTDLALRRSFELPRNRRKRQAKLEEWLRDNWPSAPTEAPEPSSPPAERPDPDARSTQRRATVADVPQVDSPTDAIVGDWLRIPDVADRLGLPVNRLNQLLRDRKLLAVQRANGEVAVPAGFLDGNQIIHGLGGTLNLLFDCGFSDTEALAWLFTADDSLPGTPVQALTEHRSTEVNRRAKLG
jgi:hypothetical protein